MKKSTKRLLGGLALAAGAVGAAGTYLEEEKDNGNKTTAGQRKSCECLGSSGYDRNISSGVDAGPRPGTHEQRE